jgi:hypothetical protein
MLPITPKLLNVKAAQVLGRCVRIWRALLAHMPAIVIETRCALRMESLALRLARMRGRITRFEAHIHEGRFNARIDADRVIRAMLEGLKEDVRAIRCEVAILHGVPERGYGALRLVRARDALLSIASQTYSAADRLVWEIEQHDQAYA